MARLSFLSLLAFTALGVAQAGPLVAQNPLITQDAPVRTMQGWSWKDCGLPDDVVQVQSIVVSPDPPQPGQNLTVTVKATATETVEEGASADVTVKLGLVKLLSKSFDLCDEARNANVSVQCPIEKGDYEVTHIVALPNEIPRAKFSVSAQGYTVDDENLFCVNLQVDFMKNPFPKFGW
ncbi:hypothetical protein EWM64_g417 [Hericium alpestre]|uniref:Phosphatidylglycerol/phosphatidylinositol transfer protein n=1 Tax=Hericium alpestre TaxID=135208 RepID=A0A4Z0ACU0_9AGAM|nr:hypothetical protein EWM64_g417 [Hericium alpestre]